MEVTKHGKTIQKKLTRQFACKQCGCVFKCEEDEYYKKPQTEYGLNSATYSCTKKYITCCPECHKIVEDEEYDSAITSKCVNTTPTGTMEFALFENT